MFFLNLRKIFDSCSQIDSWTKMLFFSLSSAFLSKLQNITCQRFIQFFNTPLTVSSILFFLLTSSMSSQLKTCVPEIGISFSRCTIEKLPPVVGVSVKKNMFIEVKFENGDDPKHSGGLVLHSGFPNQRYVGLTGKFH